MFKYNVYSLFFAYFKKQNVFKNVLCRPQYPSWVFTLRALASWVCSQLFHCEVKRNLESSAIFIIGRRYGRLLCVYVCVFLFIEDRNVLFLLELPQLRKMDTVLI